MTSKNAKQPEEQPRNKVADKVISSKRKYFLPDEGVTIESDSQNASEAVKRRNKEQS